MSTPKIIMAVFYALTAFPFAYVCYRFVALVEREEDVLKDTIAAKILGVHWFLTRLIFAFVAIGAVDDLLVLVGGRPPLSSAWILTGYMLIGGSIACSLAMIALDWLLRMAVRVPGRLLVGAHVLAVFFGISFAGMFQACIARIYYLSDVGLRTHQERVGSTGGPVVGLDARLPIYLLRWNRGTVVSIDDEKSSALPTGWQQSIDERFHIRDHKTGWVARIVGLPGETVLLEGGVVRINGVRLDEPYASDHLRDRRRCAIHLGNTDYLLAEDTRRSGTKDRPYIVVHERQLRTRHFFVLWPFDQFGFVQLPTYNIENTKTEPLRINRNLLERMATM